MSASIEQKSGYKYAVTKAADQKPTPGRRSYLEYFDHGVTGATEGWMRAEIIKAKEERGATGWHYHTCQGQYVYVVKGWVKIQFEDGVEAFLEGGDSMFIPGGYCHNEIATSEDLEALEISIPATMGTVAAETPAAWLGATV